MINMAKYDTKIDATGSNGNIFAILGTARQLLKELGEQPYVISKLMEDVFNAHSYDEACSHIEKYFRLIKE
jgi:hypothetical protein